MSSKIVKIAISGIFWTTGQRLLNLGVQLISGIVLSRLLTPEDYGCIGMLAIFMVISEAFLDGGFGSALIQKENPTQDDYSTVFFWNMGMSIVLYSILFFIAPFISDFYNMPLLCPVLRVQGLVLIISAFSIVQKNQFNKRFQFKKIAIISLISSVIALGTSIYMAIIGWGVWSLVLQSLLLAGIPSLLYCVIGKWVPSFRFSKESFMGLFSFGFFIFLTNLINNICNNIEGLLIGRFYNATTMGYFSKSKSTANLATMALSQSLQQVTYPLYSKYQNDHSALVDIIKKATSFTSFVVFPMMALLVLLATPIFTLLYSDKWLASVPYFQILCFSCMASCLQGINTLSIAAIGKSKAMVTYTIYKRLLGFSMIIIGMLLWGIYGLLVGMVLQSWFAYVINVNLVSKYIGYSLKKQIFDLAPTVILTFVGLAFSLLLSKCWDSSSFYNYLIKVVVFLSVYLIGSFLLNLRAVSYTKVLLKKIMIKYNK